jgi:hypothetical protein
MQVVRPLTMLIGLFLVAMGLLDAGIFSNEADSDRGSGQPSEGRGPWTCR